MSSPQTLTGLSLWIGRTIQRHRLSRNMELSRLAGALHVSTSAMDNIERGSRRITAASLYLVAKELRLGIEDFFPIREGDATPETITFVRCINAQNVPDLKVCHRYEVEHIRQSVHSSAPSTYKLVGVSNSYAVNRFKVVR